MSVAILAYVGLRAGSIAITHDEALTWWWHVTGDWGAIVMFQTPGLADNNHVLFTLLAKLCVAAFGLSELALRLPSLLGLVAFLAGSHFVLRRVAPGWGQVVGLVAIGLNPYVVDYFTVARGYGLGLGLMMLGLATLIAAMADRPRDLRPAKARAALLLFAFAALANLVFLLPLLAAIALLGSRMLVGRVFAGEGPREPLWKTAWAIGWPTLPIGLYLVLRPIRVLRGDGLLTIGGTHGFWLDTVGSLVDGTTYANPWLVAARGWIFVWIAITLSLVLPALAALLKSDRRRFVALAIVAGVTVLAAVGSVLQFWWLDVALLEGRRALFFLPLFIVLVVAVGAMPRTALRTALVPVFVAAAVVPIAWCVHNLASMNVQYVRDWRYDAGSREVMLAVERWLTEHPSPQPARLRANWIYVPSSMFYRSKLHLEASLHQLSPEERPGYDGLADLYHVDPRDLPAIAKFDVRPLLRSSMTPALLVERVGRGELGR